MCTCPSSPPENEACLAAYHFTPAQLLFNAGVLGPRTTVVHATHVSRPDMDLLGGTQTFACLCPTTERDLADGLGPARALASAGCRLTIGTDSHAVIDPLEEARGIELTERLATRERGHFTADELARALTMDGHACLGWPDAGEIAAWRVGRSGHPRLRLARGWQAPPRRRPWSR